MIEQLGSYYFDANLHRLASPETAFIPLEHFIFL